MEKYPLFKRIIKNAAIIISAYIVLMLIILFFDLDMFIPRLLYTPNIFPPWPNFDAPLWHFLYHYGAILPLTVGIISLAGIFIKRLRQYRRYFVFIVLSIIIGPGIIVHTLKDTWGRPRPGELIEFGGIYRYYSVFEPNFKLIGNPDDGKSFPSGHSAVAFSLMCLYFVFKKRNKKIAYSAMTAAALFGGLMGTTRIIQGGHYISDVITSFFIVYMVCCMLSSIILEDQQ